MRAASPAMATAPDRPTRGQGIVVGLVLVVLLAGVAIRLVRIDDPPLAFSAIRQHNDALLARNYARVLGLEASGFDRAVVRAASPAEIEPPVLEAVTATVWRIVGDDPLWIPRVLAIAAWTIGGWFLFLALRRVASPVAGLAATVVWSFAPFAIAVSRTFQPDPLMVSAIVVAMWALVVEDDERSMRWLVAAGLLGGLAIFFKAQAAFLVVAVFLALTFRRGRWRVLWSARTVVYAVLVLAPALLWYLGALVFGDFVERQESRWIEPHLLVHGTFWRGWADIAAESYGIALVLATVVGALLARGRARWIAAALLAGYVAFGLAFTHHYMTHDYYHLSFVAVAATAIGLLTDRAIDWIRESAGDRRPLAVGIVAVCGTVLVALAVVEPTRVSAVPAAATQRERLENVEVSRLVGDLSEHSTKVVYVAPNAGTTLTYYGGLAGTRWPDELVDDSVEATLAEIRRDGGAEYFVVTDSDGWRANPELRAFLRDVPLVASGSGYRIFDLRRTPLRSNAPR